MINTLASSLSLLCVWRAKAIWQSFQSGTSNLNKKHRFFIASESNHTFPRLERQDCINRCTHSDQISRLHWVGCLEGMDSISYGVHLAKAFLPNYFLIVFTKITGMKKGIDGSWVDEMYWRQRGRAGNAR